SFNCCKNFCCRACVKKNIETSKSVKCIFCEKMLTWDFCKENKLITSKKRYDSLDHSTIHLSRDIENELISGFDRIGDFSRFIYLEIPKMFLEFCLLLYYKPDACILETFIVLMNRLRKRNSYFITEDILKEDFKDLEIKFSNSNIEFQNILFSKCTEVMKSFSSMLNFTPIPSVSSSTIYVVSRRRICRSSPDSVFRDHLTKQDPGISAVIIFFYALLNACYPKFQNQFFLFNGYLKTISMMNI